MTGSTFNDLVGSGSSMAAAPVEWEDFAALVHTVNERFGLSLTPQRDAFELFQDRIRFVAGCYWDEVQPVQRKDVLDRLRKLHRHLRAVTTQLSPLRGGLHEDADLEVVNLLAQSVEEAHRNQHPRAREELEISLKKLEELEGSCERALALVTQSSAKKGQRGLRWYDEYMALMVSVADLLGLPVSTAGDRVEDPYATPFTVLVFEVERVLPEGASSKTLVACSRRIARSLKSQNQNVEQI